MSAHPAVGSRNVPASRLCWSSTSAGWQGTSSRLRRPSCVSGCTPRRTTWSCCNRTPDSHIRPYNQPISWFADINTHRRRLFFLFFLGQRTNSHSLPSSPLPLEVRPIYTARGSGERCKLPQWHMGEAPAYKRFGAYWSQKVQLWRQQFLLIFLRKKLIFCTKQAWYRTALPYVSLTASVSGSNSSERAAPCEEIFSRSSRHHCPMKVGVYVSIHAGTLIKYI